jgi:hypothetical protein
MTKGSESVEGQLVIRLPRVVQHADPAASANLRSGGRSGSPSRRIAPSSKLQCCTGTLDLRATRPMGEYFRNAMSRRAERWLAGRPVEACRRVKTRCRHSSLCPALLVGL